MYKLFLVVMMVSAVLVIGTVPAMAGGAEQHQVKPFTLNLALLATLLEDPPHNGGEHECSHGFYKNHTELWFGLACGETDGLTDEQLLNMLKARGPGSEAIREAARQILQDCTGLTCEDD